MAWYWYKRGGWEIAVDAISHFDASQHIKRFAPGAEYQGEYTPPMPPNYSMATAMTTAKRQEEISAALRKSE